ncbi:MAG: class I SAM-dependent methyltransferase [Acidobacteria bacterium]|nr:class I SAM-dependent methyltransferase [Acidobacteriota bacterium]
MARSARDFPLVSAALDDAAIRALFTERFLVATEIYDALVDAACWKLLGDIGALPWPGPGGERDEEDLLAQYPERARPALRYMVEKLVDAGFLRRVSERGAAGEAPASPGAPAPINLLRKSSYALSPTGAQPGAVGSLAAELAAAEPDAAVGAEIVSLLADEGAAFLRGEKTGEEILFSPARLPLWIRYFSNANILYAINNTLGAEALTRVLPASGAEILEIGGGCGSAAEAALSRLGTRVARWRFTELVPTFARRGERAARAAAAPGTLVEAAKLDMTKPWAEQGVVPGTFDAVYSVNCFHVAPDLGFVLAEAKAALKPGGVVVVSECVKPGAHPPPSYVDFVFNFLASFTNVTLDPVLRPNHGFLSPAAWRASFAAAGLHGVEVLPDVDAVAARFPKFFVGALVARA